VPARFTVLTLLQYVCRPESRPKAPAIRKQPAQGAPTQQDAVLCCTVDTDIFQVTSDDEMIPGHSDSSPTCGDLLTKRSASGEAGAALTEEFAVYVDDDAVRPASTPAGAVA
jgi:hypothetical protein